MEHVSCMIAYTHMLQFTVVAPPALSYLNLMIPIQPFIPGSHFYHFYLFIPVPTYSCHFLPFRATS